MIANKEETSTVEKDCDGFRDGSGIYQCCLNCARYNRPCHPTTAEKIKELRETTGAGLMECKKALQLTGDFDDAVEMLREAGYAVYVYCNRMIPIDPRFDHRKR